MHSNNLAVMLIDAIKAGTESGEISRINAANDIVSIESYYNFESMFRDISHDVGNFLMGAYRFNWHLKRATGRNRDEWLALGN